MKLSVILVVGIIFVFNLQAVSLEELRGMTSEEKRSFFLQEEGKELDESDDFFPALLIGLKDEDEEVQEVAVSLVARIIPALQGMKSNDSEIPFDLSLIPEVQSVLTENVSSDNTRIKSGSVTALVYSESPNAWIESTLLKSIDAERDPKIKAHILDSLISSGYDSDRIDSVLLKLINSENRHVVTSAAKGIEVLTPDGGLEALSAHLNEDSLIRLRSIVRAIAAYGDLAKAYLPELNEILSNPNIGGSIINDLERAIAAIDDPSTLQKRNINRSVDLYAPAVEVAPAPPVEEVAEATEEITTPEPAIEKPAEEVAAEPVVEDVEPSSNWLLWLIGAVVVVGGVVLLRPRK